ncbi:MAG: MFS transporter [Acidobacteriota bacterium]
MATVTSLSSPTSTVRASGFANPGALGLACLAHFVNDTYSSFIFPLLPLMTAQLHLSAAQAFWLIPVYALFSNFLQPVYGMLSDRWSRRGFALVGPLLAALFLSAIGYASSYTGLIVLLIVGGMGVGMFHPQGAAMAAVASGQRRRLGMALFSVAGTLGVAFGPFVVTQTITRFSLETTLYLALGSIPCIVGLFFWLPPLPTPKPILTEVKAQTSPEPIGPSLLQALQLASVPLLALYAITVVRAAMQMLINAYYPFILQAQGASLLQIGNALTIFLLAGGIGGLAGGFLAERFGGRTVTVFSGIASGPLLAAAFLVPSQWALPWLICGGFALGATIPVNVAMAQELVPQRTATVSALMMGFAWGVGSLAPRAFEPLTPFLGGYHGAIIGLALCTTASTILVLWLPREVRRPLWRPTWQRPHRFSLTRTDSSLAP